MHMTLAQVTSLGLNTYLTLAKLIAIMVLFVFWCLAVQWVDRDADRVKTSRERWNLMIAGAGLGGLAVCLLMPWAGLAYFVGLAFWVIPGGGLLLTYVVHRNGRVIPASRVLTVGHLKRTMEKLRGEKKAKSDKGIRVKLVDSEGEPIEKPDDVEELVLFDATQDFLFDLLWRRASDVDVQVKAESARVAYKIDGVVAEQTDVLGADDAEKVLSYLKKIAGLNVEERRRPQVGLIRAGLLGLPGKPERVEVQTSGSTSGERLRLRILRTAELMKPESLGFSEARLAEFRELVDEETGLVLFAGPAESGITTTQYATIRCHDAFLQNIYTLESEKLMELDHITQHIHDRKNPDVSYPRMLQTVLRREPDIVMVSQCADRETAELLCRAATGEKKVYGGIRATNCFDAIGRLLALTENPKLVGKCLKGVVSQRLLRVLCPACREAYKPDDALLRKANLPVDEIENFYRPPSAPILDKKGREIICQTCQGSRHVGRTGVFEVLTISDALRSLIVSGAPLKQIKAQARKEKMLYLQEEGLLKVIDGTTSMAEVMRGLRTDSK